MQSKIVFIHVPKCGGTSLNAAFAEHFEPNKIARISASQSLAIAKMLNQPLSVVRQTLLSDRLIKGYSYVSGHVHFDLNIYQQFCDRYSFITVLRDPVERWISLYFYNRFKRSHHCKINLELKEFVKTEKAKREGNIYSRYFKNVKCLRYFKVVACLNDRAEMAQVLRNKIGFEIALPRLNENPKNSGFINNAITEDLYRQIENICIADIAFYKQAQHYTK